MSIKRSKSLAMDLAELLLGDSKPEEAVNEFVRADSPTSIGELPKEPEKPRKSETLKKPETPERSHAPGNPETPDAGNVDNLIKTPPIKHEQRPDREKDEPAHLLKTTRLESSEKDSLTARSPDSAETTAKTSHSVRRDLYSVTSIHQLPAQQAALLQSENLRIAQNRILELEKELERVRRDNEQLAAAGEVLKRQLDTSGSRMQYAEEKRQQLQESITEERALINLRIAAKDKELLALATKVEELELRLSTDLKRVRVRERELENRLEILKREGSVLLRNKDDHILELKRHIDQLETDTESYRLRNSEINRMVEATQDKIKRLAKTLRLALSIVDDETRPAKTNHDEGPQ